MIWNILGEKKHIYIYKYIKLEGIYIQYPFTGFSKHIVCPSSSSYFEHQEAPHHKRIEDRQEAVNRRRLKAIKGRKHVNTSKIVIKHMYTIAIYSSIKEKHEPKLTFTLFSD